MKMLNAGNRIEKGKIILVGLVVFLISGYVTAEVLTADQVMSLKKAGADGELITEIVENQAISRGLVTVKGVVKMKGKGVEDETIISLIKAGNPTLSEAAIESKKDRLLKNRIERQIKLLQLQRKRLAVMADFLQKLINNEDFKQLVQEEKISGEDYRRIIKYMKQYARDEPTDEFDDDNNIELNIEQRK